jgi:hypothetical protein
MKAGRHSAAYGDELDTSCFIATIQARLCWLTYDWWGEHTHGYNSATALHHLHTDLENIVGQPGTQLDHEQSGCTGFQCGCTRVQVFIRIKFSIIHTLCTYHVYISNKALSSVPQTLHFNYKVLSLTLHITISRRITMLVEASGPLKMKGFQKALQHSNLCTHTFAVVL